MPQNKTIKDLVLSLSILSIFSLIIFLIFPIFQSKAEGNLEIKDIVLSTDTVNTYDGEGDQTVTIWARLSTGTETPIQTATVIIEPPPYTNARSFQEEMTLEDGDCSEIGIDLEDIVDCGTATDGIYKGEVTFPKPSLPGPWPVRILFVDENENEADFTWAATITNSTDTEDVTPPEIVAWGFEQETINTENGDEEITMYLRLRDDISGLPPEFNHTLSFQAIDSSLPEDTRYTVDFEFDLMKDDEVCALLDESLREGLDTCGDEIDGIHIATTTLPQYSPKGVWKIAAGENDTNIGDITLWDIEGNIRNLYNDPSIELSFTNNATIHDVTPPELKNITMTPSTFNSNLGDVDITITMEVKDDLSGVKEATVYIRPLLSLESLSVTKELEEPVKDGEITFTITIPQHSKTGLWVVDSFSISDNIKNGYYISGFRKLSFAYPNLELFLINQAITDEVLIEDDWYLEEWDDYGTGYHLTHPLMSIKFESGTIITKKEGGSFALHRMLTRKYDMSKYTNLNELIQLANKELTNDLQECSDVEGCSDSLLNTNNLTGQPINLIKMGIPGLNLSFSKPVTISIAVDDEYLGTTFVIQTFDHQTDQWTNETTCLVKTVEPSSYESGGSKDGFFAPAPYTACQFTVDHASFFSSNILGQETSEDAGVPDTGIGGPLNYFRRWLR